MSFSNNLFLVYNNLFLVSNSFIFCNNLLISGSLVSIFFFLKFGKTSFVNHFTNFLALLFFKEIKSVYKNVSLMYIVSDCCFNSKNIFVRLYYNAK